jgi:hypothetical protein
MANKPPSVLLPAKEGRIQHIEKYSCQNEGTSIPSHV